MLVLGIAGDHAGFINQPNKTEFPHLLVKKDFLQGLPAHRHIHPFPVFQGVQDVEKGLPLPLVHGARIGVTVRAHFGEQLVSGKIQGPHEVVELGVEGLGELLSARIEKCHAGKIVVGHERVIENRDLLPPLPGARQERREGQPHVELLEVGIGVERQGVYDMAVEVVDLFLGLLRVLNDFDAGHGDRYDHDRQNPEEPTVTHALFSRLRVEQHDFDAPVHFTILGRNVRRSRPVGAVAPGGDFCGIDALRGEVRDHAEGPGHGMIPVGLIGRARA